MGRNFDDYPDFQQKAGGEGGIKLGEKLLTANHRSKKNLDFATI